MSCRLESLAWRASVEVAAIAPYQGHATALRRALPGRGGIDRSRRTLAQPRELLHPVYARRPRAGLRSAQRGGSTGWSASRSPKWITSHELGPLAPVRSGPSHHQLDMVMPPRSRLPHSDKLGHLFQFSSYVVGNREWLQCPERQGCLALHEIVYPLSRSTPLE